LERTVKRLLVATGLVALGACGDGGPDLTLGAGPAAPSTTLVLQATNHDPIDYALWIEGGDGAGVGMTHLLSLSGDARTGFTMDYRYLWADPFIPYTVFLAAPDGTLYDALDLWLPAGSPADVRFDVLNGLLIRRS
jgi:hypothetical protein